MQPQRRHRCRTHRLQIETRKRLTELQVQLYLGGLSCGAIAQLGERYNGIVEVDGSIPSGSTKNSSPHRLEAQDTALSRQ